MPRESPISASYGRPHVAGQRWRLKPRKKFQCPNPDCGKSFDATTKVLQHLNNPLSSCIKWSRDAENAISTNNSQAEEYLAQFQRSFAAPMGDSTNYDTLLEPGVPAPPSPATASAETSAPEAETQSTFPGAAVAEEGGTSFMDWMGQDQFAHVRRQNPYYPFAGKLEWEIARFLALSSLTMKEINDFMKLGIVERCLAPWLSFKTAKELRSRIELLPTGPAWSSQTISYPGFPTKKPIVLFYRNPLDCIQLLLRNPLFKDHIDLIPTQIYRGQERLHKEWINSDGAWNLQSAVKPGRTILGVITSSDKTNISVMNGDRIAHPFLVSLANIRMDVALKASSHAFLMAGLLPVPKFLCDKKLRGVMEARLFHRCLDIICHPLKLAARDGTYLSTSDGKIIHAHTPLVSYIVDTPEAADVACVKGKTSHLTMASHKTFGDAERHPERTGASTWAAICSVSAAVPPDNVAEYLKASKAHAHRLNGVDQPFWRNWPLSTDPSKFLTPEVLHHIHKGFFDHDFQWGRTILGNSEIDFRLSVIQPRVGSRHFREGVTRLKQLGGREHRELERSFVCVLADAVRPNVLNALRGLMDFRFMAQAPQIDEQTLGRMEQSLALFHQYKQTLIDDGGREQDHFHIPKLEFLHSVVPSIRWAGVPMQYTADITEKSHSTQIKVPARTETNHRDYDPQLVRHLDREEKLRLFELYTGIRSGELQVDIEDVNDDNFNELESDSAAPASAGDSTRTIRNLFRAATLYPMLHPDLESRFVTTPSTAFLLNRRPTHSRVAVDDVAAMFGVLDLRAALADFLAESEPRDGSKPLIGGRRRNAATITLPFTHLDIWHSVRVQTRAPHTNHPLQSQLVFAQPAGVQDDWPIGRYDAVLLCNNLSLPWPGKGFRDGLNGHTVAQVRIIMRPTQPPNTPSTGSPFLVYGHRFDIVSQSTPDNREASTGQFLLRKAQRADKSRMGGVFAMDHIRTPLELIPRFGAKADGRLTPATSTEYSAEVRLNKYSSKELFWIFDSVSLPSTL
ncbi:hypothetical protein HMN09_00296900 [Mycena chlorophos]|uniref:DUF6830 domain-containing protein n=1 Tax=Mycena chlorophos TaxID=658473 RepID=A0A8H6TIU7_MYCCL|nr:hypothetical protein HMN09_00296900 [Mycena chlorophos]